MIIGTDETFLFLESVESGQEKFKAVCLMVMHPHHRLFQPCTLNLAAMLMLKF